MRPRTVPRAPFWRPRPVDVSRRRPRRPSPSACAPPAHQPAARLAPGCTGPRSWREPVCTQSPARKRFASGSSPRRTPSAAGVSERVACRSRTTSERGAVRGAHGRQPTAPASASHLRRIPSSLPPPRSRALGRRTRCRRPRRPAVEEPLRASARAPGTTTQPRAGRTTGHAHDRQVRRRRGAERRRVASAGGSRRGARRTARPGDGSAPTPASVGSRTPGPLALEGSDATAARSRPVGRRPRSRGAHRSCTAPRADRWRAPSARRARPRRRHGGARRRTARRPPSRRLVGRVAIASGCQKRAQARRLSDVGGVPGHGTAASPLPRRHRARRREPPRGRHSEQPIAEQRQRDWRARVPAAPRPPRGPTPGGRGDANRLVTQLRRRADLLGGSRAPR